MTTRAEKSTLRRFLSHPSGLVGLIILALVVGMSLSAGWLFPSGPWTMAGAPRTWPGADPRFPLGTDALGRDMLSALFYGSRVSLIIGAAAGYIATRIMDLDTSVPVTIAIGVIGALIGGLVLTMLLAIMGMAAGFVGAILGALLLIWLWQTYIAGNGK